MKKMLLFIILILIYQNGFSQDSQSKTPINYLSVSPQHIIINGMRLEFEKRFNQSSHAIIIAPSWYFGTIGENSLLNSNFNEYELNGFGIEAGHKIYADKSWSKNVNWYQAYSIAYNRFNFDYQGFGWIPFIDDPTLLNLGEQQQTLIINQFSIATYMGAVVIIEGNFFIDVYFGIGAKRSIADDSSTDDFAAEDFQSGFINYNFTGAIVKSGFKFGFAF